MPPGIERSKTSEEPSSSSAEERIQARGSGTSKRPLNEERPFTSPEHHSLSSTRLRYCRTKGRPLEKTPVTLHALQQIYEQPFFDLIQQGRDAYLEHWKDDEVQLCTLLSIKTGGC